MEHPLPASAPASEKRALLEQKVANSEQQILDLKTRRNMLAPISKLSSETLLRIFDLLKDDEYDPFNHHLSRPFLTKHIIVHVCRHWRSLAFSVPALWNKPPLWNNDWALKYLKFSKSEPLDVKIRADTKRPLWTTALMEMPRIKKLSISGFSASLNEIQKFLRANKSLDAPSLEKISFQFQEIFGAQPTLFKLLDDTFPKTNALRHLKLRNVTVNWDSPLFRNQLTTLRLEETPASQRPTWKQLMDVLRDMPSLETLTLVRTCPQNDQACVDEVVHLPNLQNFFIDCDAASQIKVFLSQVTFPQLRVIEGGFYALSSGAKDYMEILDPLLKLLPAEAKIEDAVTSMKLTEIDHQKGLHVALGSVGSSTSPVLSLHLPFIKAYDSEASVSSILHSLKLSNLLFVGFYSYFDLLEKCFGNQQKIVTIEIGYAVELPGLTKALEISADHPQNTPVPFPNLKTIGLTQIHGLPWRNKSDNADGEDEGADKDDEEGDDEDEKIEEDWDYDDWDLPPKRTWTDFRNCLKRRAQWGVPVQELLVRKCTGLSMDWFSFFQSAAPVVKWDQHRVY